MLLVMETDVSTTCAEIISRVNRLSKCQSLPPTTVLRTTLTRTTTLHFHISIVYMYILLMLTQGLDRCMSIITWGFHVYGSHCQTHNNLQSLAGLFLLTPNQYLDLHLEVRHFESKVSCPKTQCNDLRWG